MENLEYPQFSNVSTLITSLKCDSHHHSKHLVKFNNPTNPNLRDEKWTQNDCKLQQMLIYDENT
jgi:hypothetical protein